MCNKPIIYNVLQQSDTQVLDGILYYNYQLQKNVLEDGFVSVSTSGVMPL